MSTLLLLLLMWFCFSAVFYYEIRKWLRVFHDCCIFSPQTKAGLICVTESDFFLKTHYLCIATNYILVFLKRLNDLYDQEKSLCCSMLLWLHRIKVEFKCIKLIQMPEHNCRNLCPSLCKKTHADSNKDLLESVQLSSSR